MSTKVSLSRRRFCLCCIGVAAGGWLTAREAFSKARDLVSLITDSAATAPIVAHKLRCNLVVLEGSGGNVAVLPGSDGQVLIDAGIAVSQQHMEKVLADISADPVSHLINTHWHFDHTSGNTWLNAAGAKIIAHENTRKYLSQVQRVEDWDHDFPALPKGGMPTEVFAEGHNLKLNGQTIALRHYDPAHTDSDISVRFSEANVVHVADTFWNGVYPFIDYSTGGSIDGMIEASDTNIAAVDHDTIIVAGHGKAVGTKTELREFRNMLVSIRDRVANLKRQGRSLDDTIAAKPTAAFDAQFGNYVIDPALFTRLVYEGV